MKPPTALLDLCIEGRKKADKLCQPHPALLHDLEHPVVWFSVKQLEELREIISGKNTASYAKKGTHE